MKNKLLLLAFLLIASNRLSAQKITINIAADFFKDSQKSALIVSDELGKVLYETLILEKDLGKNFSISYERYLDRQHHITIINEYLNIYNKPYHKIRTFYDVEEELNITETIFYEYSDLAYLNLKLNIYDVEELHGIVMNSGKNDNYRKVKTKSKRKLLRILYQQPEKSDLYFVLHGNNEDFFRYLYLPEEEIAAVNDLFWADLPEDLQAHELVFPDKEIWQGFIRAKSEYTDNTCYFYELNSNIYEEKHQYFIPESLFFYDYELFFQRRAKISGRQRNYTYYSKSEEMVELPKITEKDFDLNLDYYDQHGFGVELAKKMDEVQLYCSLGKENSVAQFAPTPDWTIVAKNTDEINFQYPVLTTLLLAYFPDLQYSIDEYPYKIHQVQKDENGCEIRVTEEIKY